MKYTVSCPLCSKSLFILEGDFEKICKCPRCHEELYFTKADIEVEPKRKSQFKFIIAKFDNVETIINTLYKEEGWYVVSQSTVFLSGFSGSIGGIGAGTREEGLAIILRKDDEPCFVQSNL